MNRPTTPRPTRSDINEDATAAFECSLSHCHSGSRSLLSCSRILPRSTSDIANATWSDKLSLLKDLSTCNPDLDDMSLTRLNVGVDIELRSLRSVAPMPYISDKEISSSYRRCSSDDDA
jgi:hypothetical protein